MAADPAMHDAALFEDLLLILVTALATVALCRPLRLPGTLGYFAAGAVLGPTGLGLIGASAEVAALAEFGVVLLLFSLGLEFSLPRMLAMRRAVFGLGSLQVLLTGGLFAAVLALAGFDPGLAVLLGGGLALSSTALVSRELVETGQLHRPHGRQALGVLLFQDLFAVFLLILVPVLAAGDSLGQTALLLGGRGVLLFIALMLAGRYLLPPLFGEIARSRSSELFVLLALVVVMAAAWLTRSLGLSMALGGFVGGMMLGESHYRHQLQADIRPFRDLLLGLFLVTVGMMLDLQLLADYWPRILAFGLILMLVKSAILFGVSRLLGYASRDALRTGVVLAQGGEFAFAMLALAAAAGLVAPQVQAFMVAVTLVSMLLTPLLVRRSDWIADRVLGPAPDEMPAHLLEPGPAARPGTAVLLLGYGRVGQAVGRLLQHCGIEHLALDADAGRVADARLAGAAVRYGDATRADLLEAAGLGEVRLVVICLDAPVAVRGALQAVRSLAPRVPVLVRARDEAEGAELLAAGATEVVPETLESSFMLLAHTAALLGRPRARTEALLAQVRADRYRLLHGVIAGDDRADYPVLAHPVLLPEGAAAIGRSLDALAPLPEALEIQGVRRREATLSAAQAGPLESGDIVILIGPGDAVEVAEDRLLGG